jgi:hypothetical protein
VRKHVVGARIPGHREGRRRRAHGACDDRTGQDREGEGPREEEAQESQVAVGPQRCGHGIPTRRGEETPAARPHRTRRPECGGDHRRAVEDPGRTGLRKEHPTTTSPCAEAERRRSRVRARGDAFRRTAGPFGSVTSQCQSQEGRLRREAQAIRVVSSSEGRTPRARLVERHQGDRNGSKASKPAGTARMQQDPKEATSGVVARSGWVALKGKETSREQKAPEDGVTVGRGTL